jgi:MFS family permease
LVALFFLQGAAIAMWMVPLSTVLSAHGLQHLTPYAFVASALAAFVSPLIFGAMADRHASPVKVLRGLAIATAVTMASASTAIKFHAGPWVVLAIIQLHALCSAPISSISSTVVFARLSDPRKEFGPIRAMLTLGWMAGCLIISVLSADASVLAGYTGSITWLIVAAFTFLLPSVEVPKSAENLTLRQRFGLDALVLLKHRDHRVVFLTTILFSIPLSAFYPYAPLHLKAVGLQHTSAWMTLGQVTEMVAMFSVGGLLLKWRLKWIFAFGLAFGVARFVFSAFNTQSTLLIGILLHGASYTLVFITAQIYLDQRVDSSWRARAQALLGLVNGGVGNLLGYIFTAWWFKQATGTNGPRWPFFWNGLAVVVAVVLFFFLIAYRGRGAQSGKLESPPS